MNQLINRDAVRAIQALQHVLEESEALTTDMREFTNHFFAPGIYLRTLFIPAGHVLVGEWHKEEALNILLKGRISVITSSGDKILADAPFIFKSAKGQKAGFAVTDVWYASIHPNEDDCTDIKQLENKMTIPITEALEVLQ